MSKIKKGEVRNPFGRKGRPKRMRGDGWSNAISAMGSSRDTSEYTSFAPDLSVDINQLQQLYRSDGYAKKIIDLPVKEMMREWIEIENDIDGSIAVEFRNQNLKKSIAEALRWSRLYGGSLCVALIDDGRDLNEPVDENFVEGIYGYRVYDRYQISWTSGITNQNTKSMRYGYPEIYRVTPYTVGEPYEVHYTRVLRFDGEQLPEKERLRNQGWGDSVLQSVYRELRRLGATTGYIENIIRQFEQITISVQGLTHLIASNQEEALVKRFQIMDMTRSVLNSIFLDADGEQFAKHSSSVAGLSDLMDRFMLSLAGVTNIPATKLFGRSPSGLNSTGESDIKQFYDYIRSQQEDLLREHLEYVLRLTTLGMGLNPDDYGIKFKSLMSPTEQETVATRFQVAQTDQIYYQMGLDPDVIFKNRFGGEQYSIDTIIDEEMLSDIDYPEDLTVQENLDAIEDDIDMTPTKEMADNARRGLELRKEFGRGGTEVGVRRAVQLENRQNLSRETIYRMSSYFARHANYEKESNPPSAGYIAWLLWGGDAGRDWAERKTAEIEAWEQKNA